MKKVLVVIIAVVAIGISGCSLSGNTHQSAQAAATDHSPGGVSQMPSGFRNVAYKCIKVGESWYAVFSTSIGGNGDNKSGAVAAVLAPTCHNWGP